MSLIVCGSQVLKDQEELRKIMHAGDE